MPRQFWSEPLAVATSTATAIANSTTETILVPNVTIPANYMQDARCLRGLIIGSYGTTSTPTLTFSTRWGGVGGTVISKSAAATMTSATGGGASMTAMFQLEFLIQTRTNGSSGKLMTNGMATMGQTASVTAATATTYEMAYPMASGSTGGTTPVEVTVDLTTDTALAITATWGTSNAANSIQAIHYVLEALN